LWFGERETALSMLFRESDIELGNVLRKRLEAGTKRTKGAESDSWLERKVEEENAGTLKKQEHLSYQKSKCFNIISCSIPIKWTVSFSRNTNELLPFSQRKSLNEFHIQISLIEGIASLASPEAIFLHFTLSHQVLYQICQFWIRYSFLPY
jgi:hypothetical protein